LISLQAVLKLLLIAFAGVLLEKCGYMDSRLRIGVARVIYYCLLPCLLFTSIAANINWQSLKSVYVVIVYGAITPLIGIAVGSIIARFMTKTEKFGYGQSVSCIGLGNSGYLPLVFVPAVLLMNPFNEVPNEGEAKSEMALRLSELGMSYVSTFHIAFMPILWFFGRRYLINPYKAKKQGSTKLPGKRQRAPSDNMPTEEAVEARTPDPAQFNYSQSERSASSFCLVDGKDESQTTSEASTPTKLLSKGVTPTNEFQDENELTQEDEFFGKSPKTSSRGSIINLLVQRKGSMPKIKESDSESEPIQASATPDSIVLKIHHRRKTSSVMSDLGFIEGNCQEFRDYPVAGIRGSKSTPVVKSGMRTYKLRKQTSLHEEDMHPSGPKMFPIISRRTSLYALQRKSSVITTVVENKYKSYGATIWRFIIARVTELTCIGSACFGLITPLKQLFFSTPMGDTGLAIFEPTITNSMRTLGGAVSPIVTIMLGANILAAQRKGVEGHRTVIPKSILVPCMLGKLILLPIIGTFLVYVSRMIGMVGDDPTLMFVILTQFCAPSAQNLTLMCELANHGQKEISMVLFYMHLAAIATMTAWTTFYIFYIQNVLLAM